jgi:DNA polymerase-3 subunit delta'
MNTLRHPDVKFIVALPVGKGEKSDDPPLAKLTDGDIKSIQEQFLLKANNPYHRVTIPRANIIKINSIREVRRESALSTSDGRRRVIIISRADEMGDEASNTLLKTLEEPSGNTMLVLTTSRRDALLPTIQSRCQALRFDPLTEESIRVALTERNGVDERQASVVARLANGSYGAALELLQEDVARRREEVVSFVMRVLGNNMVSLIEHIEELSASRDREMVTRFLHMLLMWFRDALLCSHGREVINLDQQDPILRFVRKFPEANLVHVIADVEKAISLVERNAYIALVLLQLSVQVRGHVLPVSTRSQSLG